MKEASAKAPGKIILIGEHAVVHGYPAIISTIDLKASCTIKPNSNGKVKLILTRFAFGKEITWEDVFESNKKTEESIKKYEKTGDTKYIANLKEISNLPKYALYETWKFLKVQDLPGIILEGDSRIPIGGFGSSSAAGAVIIKAFSKFLGYDLSDDDIVEILLRTEYKLQGYRSTGGDQNAVVRGGLIKFIPITGKNKKPRIEKIEVKRKLLKDCLIIESGSPENTTGETVAFVKEQIKKDTQRVFSIFSKINILTKRFVRALNKGDKQLLYSSIDEANEELIKLGIVTPKTQKLIEKIQLIGGHVKVSGGGAISGKGSGALICLADDYQNIIDLLENEKVDYFRTKLA